MNPYASPQLPHQPAQHGYAEGPVADAVIDQLARTKGWVLFFAVLLWIAVGVMALFGVLIFVGGAAVLGSSRRVSGVDAGFFTAMGVMYAVMALLYAIPALKLTKYSSRIGSLMYSRRIEDLVAALNEQRAFWKFVGIVMIIGMVLGILIVAMSPSSAIQYSRP